MRCMLALGLWPMIDKRHKSTYLWFRWIISAWWQELSGGASNSGFVWQLQRRWTVTECNCKDDAKNLHGCGGKHVHTVGVKRNILAVHKLWSTDFSCATVKILIYGSSMDGSPRCKCWWCNFSLHCAGQSFSHLHFKWSHCVRLGSFLSLCFLL